MTQETGVLTIVLEMFAFLPAASLNLSLSLRLTRAQFYCQKHPNARNLWQAKCFSMIGGILQRHKIQVKVAVGI
jgi:hypothetical protein